MSGEFPDDLRILVLMHIRGAVDSENAKRPAELAELLGMSVAKLHGLLQTLLDSGYVACYRDDLRRLRYFLTKLGIVKVCSAFS
jgi:DNA-binding IclR family transcriptional regulator